MATIEEHEKIAKELIEDTEEKIRLGIVERRQKIIGFSVSEASTNLFASFLHRNGLISPGFNINHRFFVSEKRAEIAFPFDFKEKQEIFKLLVKIEQLRTKLCYGRDKESREVTDAISSLFKLKNLLEGKEND